MYLGMILLLLSAFFGFVTVLWSDLCVRLDEVSLVSAVDIV